MGDAKGKLAEHHCLVQVNSLFAKLFVFLGGAFSFLSFSFLPFFLFLSFLLSYIYYYILINVFMFILKLFDRLGNEINEGDIVKISNRGYFNFFCEVKFIQEEMIITPFHTFSFHSFEKVSEVPKEAVLSSEERYNVWYLYDEDAQKDINHSDFENYLMSWRESEYHIDQKSYRIERI